MKTINIKDLKESKVFCASPWMHLHSFPNGNVIACCLSPSEEVIGNLNNQRLVDIWNNDKIKQLRLNMLEGRETPEICHRCYDKEKEGFQPLRTGMNVNGLDDQDTIKLIESTNPDGSVDQMRLTHWDFRFSNLCNLSCRSCGPGLSSSWMKDHKKIFNIAADTPALEKLPEERNNILLEDALKSIDVVKSIHFAGGEPMMMEEHWFILEELQKAKRKDVRLHYSTNMTRFKFGKKHAFDYWHDFDDIYISASIDAIGDRFNYIRNGGDWNEVYQNLKDLQGQNFKNLELAFHPTLSIFNILTFPDMVKFIWENNSFMHQLKGNQLRHYFIHVINLNPLTYPDFYSMTILPDDIKRLAAKNIEDLMKWCTDNIYHEIHNDSDQFRQKFATDVTPLQSLISFMYAKNESEKIKTFIEYTEKVDGIRGQDFWGTFPELNDLKAYK